MYAQPGGGGLGSPPSNLDLSMMPKYNPSLSAAYVPLTLPAVAYAPAQATPVAPAAPAPVYPAEVRGIAWEDLNGALSRRQGKIKHWVKRQATLSRMTIQFMKEKNKDKLELDYEYRLSDVDEIGDSVEKFKDKDDVVFGITINGTGERVVLMAESPSDKKFWVMRLRSACLLQAVRDGLGADRVAALIDSGAEVNIAEPPDRDAGGPSAPAVPVLALCVLNGMDREASLLHANGAGTAHLLRRDFIERAGFSKVFCALYDNNADLNVVANDDAACTLLHHACERNEAVAIGDLLSWPGLNINPVNGDGDTPLHVALKRGFEGVATALINANADVNQCDASFRFPIHMAITGGLNSLVVYLEKKGANLSAVDGDSNSPLHLAIQKGSVDVAKYLIACGADVNVFDAHQEHPLHVALKAGPTFKDIAALLVTRGASLHAIDGDGRTSLHLALEAGYDDLAYYMVAIDEEALAINTCDRKSGLSPLLFCARKQKLLLMWHLLDNGADPNLANFRGKTPLYDYLNKFHYSSKDADGRDTGTYCLTNTVTKLISKVRTRDY